MLVHGAAGASGPRRCRSPTASVPAPSRSSPATRRPRSRAQAGADEVVLGREGWRDQVKELSGGGVDVVLDPVGGDRFTDSLRSPARGRVALVVVGFTGGSIPEVKVNRLLLGNTEVIGAGWGAYAMAKPDLMCARCRRGTARADRVRRSPPGGRRTLPARAGGRGAQGAGRAAARPARSCSTCGRPRPPSRSLRLSSAICPHLTGAMRLLRRLPGTERKEDLRMKVIGAGLPRSATTTQMFALETLGFGALLPHARPARGPGERAPAVGTARQKAIADWERIFGGDTRPSTGPRRATTRARRRTTPTRRSSAQRPRRRRLGEQHAHTVWAVYFGDSVLHHVCEARAASTRCGSRYIDLMTHMTWDPTDRGPCGRHEHRRRPGRRDGALATARSSRTVPVRAAARLEPA